MATMDFHRKQSDFSPQTGMDSGINYDLLFNTAKFDMNAEVSVMMIRNILIEQNRENAAALLANNNFDLSEENIRETASVITQEMLDSVVIQELIIQKRNMHHI